MHAHVIAAAKSILSSAEICYESVEHLAKEIVVRFLYLDPNAKIEIKDKKCLYAMQVLTLGTMWHGFDDSVREGDGDRLFIYWKFFMLIFKVVRHFNYFKESVILQLQYNFLFPQRQAEQLKWSRFVNSKGKVGRNVSCDLHLEHLNRRLKDIIIGLQSNENAIDRAAKSIGVVHHICEIFEDETHISKESGKHVRPPFSKECKMVYEELHDQQVFMQADQRNHPSFKSIKSVLQQCPDKHLLPYIVKKLKFYQL